MYMYICNVWNTYLHICMYLHIYTYLRISIYIYIYIYMYIYMYIWMSYQIPLYQWFWDWDLFLYMCMYVCVCVCVCVYIYICRYIILLTCFLFQTYGHISCRYESLTRTYTHTGVRTCFRTEAIGGRDIARVWGIKSLACIAPRGVLPFMCALHYICIHKT